MDLFKVREQLLCKGIKKNRKLNNTYVSSKRGKKSQKLKIIGITGSCGKSTTAVILHKYLKSLGHKSVLYSSALVDSPTSIIDPEGGNEIAISNEEDLLSIIEEVEAYNAEFLILEINESTIEKKLIDELDFTVKVLTNLNPKHNLERYNEEEYTELKKSFIKNSNIDCKCVIGLQDYNSELFYELLNCNNNEKITFSTQHIAKVKNVDINDLNVYLTFLESTIDGLEMSINYKKNYYNFNTNIIGRYNALNFVCVFAILVALDMFDYRKYRMFIESVVVEGRSEKYTINDRFVIVDYQLGRIKETIEEFKNNKEINNVIVVVGAIGYGYNKWNARLKSNAFIKNRFKARKYAMNYISEFADSVYITESDNGAESAINICKELYALLDNRVPSTIVINRDEAICKAITNSKPKDLILIIGRGNKVALCHGKDKIKLFKDSEIVKKILNDFKKSKEELW